MIDKSNIIRNPSKKSRMKYICKPKINHKQNIRITKSYVHVVLWFVVCSCGLYHTFRIITPLVPCWIWCHTNILCQYTKKGEQHKNMCAYQLKQLNLILSAVNLTGWLWFSARNRNLKDEWKKENWVPLDVIWQSYDRRTAYHWHLNWLRKGAQANNLTKASNFSFHGNHSIFCGYWIIIIII